MMAVVVTEQARNVSESVDTPLFIVIHILYFHSSIHKKAKRRIYRRKWHAKAKYHFRTDTSSGPTTTTSVETSPTQCQNYIQKTQQDEEKMLNESKIQSKATARRKGTSHGLEEDATKVTQMISQSAENGIAEDIVDPRSRDRVRPYIR